jgi:hypothetical protein
VLWSIAAAATAALRPVWITVAPHLRPCTFRGLTGIPCPTCGTTRVALALLDCDIAGAFAVNPLATMAGIGFFAGALLALVWLVLRWPVVVIDGFGPRRLAVAVLILALVNWAYLIVSDRSGL